MEKIEGRFFKSQMVCDFGDIAPVSKHWTQVLDIQIVVLIQDLVY